MREVLFVCTGNVFRSMTAEYALRHTLAPSSLIRVASAGTKDRWLEVDPFIARHLRSRGIDVSGHRRRTLRGAMLAPGVAVIAMGADHRDFIAHRFGLHDVPLFTEACGLEPASLLDVHEAVPDFASNREEAEAHVRWTIDRIIELAPLLANRLVLS